MSIDLLMHARIDNQIKPFSSKCVPDKDVDENVKWVAQFDNQKSVIFPVWKSNKINRNFTVLLYKKFLWYRTMYF